ncbi:hypothetical protein [Ottowia thiooxydans]|uniref:hypothetical protein n=1 Tax=Ottowia thiooxydans TaxID=219182 RepID=UPI000424802C|nr:hypothetical protein [Ottowia thiooxydans]
MHRCHRNFSVIVAGLIGLGAAAGVQAATVTTPSGMTSSDDAAVDQQWYRAASSGASTGITADYARSGNGSILMTSPSISGSTEWRYDAASPTSFGALGTLAQFSSAQYDWYRDASSTNPTAQAPAFTLWIDEDGNSATTADRSYLIFEPYYQTNTDPAVNTWVTSTVNASSIMWTPSLSGYCAFSVFATGGTCNGTASPYSSASVVISVIPFMGSGWAGVFRGAVDNVVFNTTQSGGSLSANFELAPPPQPVTAVTAVPTLQAWGLMLTGLLLAGTVGLRAKNRRKKD